MAEIRLGKAASEFNVSTQTIIESLQKKGFAIENKPTAKLNDEMYNYISGLFSSEKEVKEQSKSAGLSSKLKKRDETTVKADESTLKKKQDEKPVESEPETEVFIKNVVVEDKPKAPVKEEKIAPVPEPEPVVIEKIVETPKPETTGGLKVKGKIDPRSR